MTVLFCQLPLGARFEFRGRRYEKLALSMARDEDRCGNVFQDATEVVTDPRTVLVEGAAERLAAQPHWTTHLAPAPPRRPAITPPPLKLIWK